MKTAISLPDELFEAADALARELGVSRSELYATAVADYVARHTRDDLTRRIDAAYAAAGEPGLDPGFAALQARAIGRDDGW